MEHDLTFVRQGCLRRCDSPDFGVKCQVCKVSVEHTLRTAHVYKNNTNSNSTFIQKI